MKKFFLSIVSAYFFLLILPLAASAIEYPFGNMSSSPTPCEYVSVLFVWGLGIVGAVAVTSIAYGGFRYMVGQVQEGKEIIYSALLGLLLLMASWLILYTINPDLATLKCKTASTASGSTTTTSGTTASTGSTATSATSGTTSGSSSSLPSSETNSAVITGKGTTTSCGISSCGSTTVQGNTMSTAAATKYTAMEKEIQDACAKQGYTCDTQISTNGTITGKHSSSCHTSTATKAGTCADFVVTGCTTSACMTIVQDTLKNSSNVTSCLNEYQTTTTYSTGNHIHCNY